MAEADRDPSTALVERALDELRRGRMVLVVDDEDRENEGDLIMAAEHATPAALAFLIRHTSGVVCVGLDGGRLDDLALPPMVARGDDPRGTAFTVSVDLKHGTTTGISAADRARTIRALADPGTRPDELSRPGHVFPLRARDGGVLRRPGHTESAVDLCRLAGLAPAGVLAEVTNDDGTMARRPDLELFAQRHGLVSLTVADLVRHRLRTEALVVREAVGRMPTAHGEFDAVAYRSTLDGVEHVALVRGPVAARPDVLVRVHSECLTGDVFGSGGAGLVGRGLSGGGHEPELHVGHERRRVDRQRGALRPRVVRLLGGREIIGRTRVAHDPDELVGVVHRPGTLDREAVLLAGGHDPVPEDVEEGLAVAAFLELVVAELRGRHGRVR